MPRLKSRDRFVPNGFKFRQPETNWPPPGSNPFQGASFDSVVRMVQQHRQGNQHYAKKYGWNLDYASIADEVDTYNARVCQSMGWTDYFAEGGAPQASPFMAALTQLSSAARHVVVGAKTIAEMFGGEGPVKPELAMRRSSVCVTCPLNDRGDWTRLFTAQAASGIRATLETFKGLDLHLPNEGELRFCTACYCPLKLKVWGQLSDILKHMPEQDFSALDPNCWIRKEKNAATSNQPGPPDSADKPAIPYKHDNQSQSAGTDPGPAGTVPVAS